MIVIRKQSLRGHTETSWLNSFHTFSFADYFDPEFMGFHQLRVINEDQVQPGMGFGRHPHKNMEIISYVIEGALEHKDSMGTGSIIRPREIQCMSAGTGIEHSEFNPSDTEILHFLQIWVIPEKNNLTPTYQQQSIPQLNNEWILIGSNEDYDGVIRINQDVKLFAAYLTAGHSIQYPLRKNRCGWLQLVKGIIVFNGHQLFAGDGVGIVDEPIDIKSINNAEFLLFDLKEGSGNL